MTQDLGDAFYTLFGGEDLVPSDLVAGMQLVKQWQKDTKQYSEENLLKNTKPLSTCRYSRPYPIFYWQHAYVKASVYYEYHYARTPIDE